MKDKLLGISILKNEERALTKIANHIQDYLTRLKVNELTIINQMKARTIEAQENSCILPSTSHVEDPIDPFGTEVNNQPLTDLDLKVDTKKKINEEEEEEDEDDLIGVVSSKQTNKIDPSTCMDQLQELLNSNSWTFPHMNVNDDDEDDYSLDMSGIVNN